MASEMKQVVAASVASNWPEAIRLLTAMLEKADPPAVPLLLCNRAFCNSKLELHRRVIMDCDSAISKDSTTVQAYIYKGHALNTLGKFQEATETFKKGSEAGQGDLHLMLQLHSLLTKSATHEPTDCVTYKAMTAEFCPSTTCPATPPQEKETLTNGCSAAKKKNGMACNDNARDKEPCSKNKRDCQSKKETRTLSLDLRLSKAIYQVNSGNYHEAVLVFNQLLKDKPGSSEALLGRGTAYAFQRKLEAAIQDFSKAIELDVSSEEAWKRRGQARAALGELEEALADFNMTLQLTPNVPDVLCERGIVLFKLKDYEGAVKDFRECTASDCSNKLAFSYFGLALVSIGHHEEGIKAHEQALELDPTYKEGWVHLAQSYQDLAESEKANECLNKALLIDPEVQRSTLRDSTVLKDKEAILRVDVKKTFSDTMLHLKYVHAYYFLGLLLRSVGNHRKAVEVLSKGLDLDPSNVDCLYLRGSCHHALGEYIDAIKDYEKAITDEVEVDSSARCTFQFLAFYQREIALYTIPRTNLPLNRFNIDYDLPALFKEAWCKRRSPVKLLKSNLYQQQPLYRYPSKSTKSDPLSKTKKVLLAAADKLGRRIQYNTPGFTKNLRQYRMAGLAGLEIAKKVWSTWNLSRGAARGRKSKRKDTNVAVSHNRGGVCSSSSSDGDDDKFISTWRDVYNIVVKWRQVSEPSEPVVWVDLLSKEEFEAGFGSHTPILLGQVKVVRYYPNFQRAFETAKKEILEKEFVFNAFNHRIDLTDVQLQDVENALDCAELHRVVSEDFWLVTPCNSSAFDCRVLDGTRLTLQRRDSGYEFSIRTPVTPDRWEQYDEELGTAWEELCQTVCSATYDPRNQKHVEKVANSILRLTFYWYNFMPLARGTAVAGYVTLLGLFLAAGLNVTADIPSGMQVDWEAILSPSFEDFTKALQWLYSSLKVDWSWQELADVCTAFGTTGQAVAVLSSYD